jgi:acyl-homoserine-lactone acylase
MGNARGSAPRSATCVALLSAALATVFAACATAPRPAPSAAAIEIPELARQVEIRRTTYGVPQILAQNLRAAAFALAYVQLEDYGTGTISGMQAARGRMALVEGPARIDADARARQRHARAVETFPLLEEDTREIYQGFADGMNHFIRVHADQLPDWMRPDFTAWDVLARDIVWPAEGAMNTFRQRVTADPTRPPLLIAADDGSWQPLASARYTRPVPADSASWPGSSFTRPPFATVAAVGGTQTPAWAAESGLAERAPPALADDNVGSNAWALAPNRTTSGHAILLRNPHLAWNAGYYEAHVRVPGKLDFYGDFRIGGPFSVIGGFNRDLGFSTTNNANRTHEFYAFRLDPERPDHVRLDGESVPLTRSVVEVEYLQEGRIASETREFWNSPFGPVVHRADSLVYVFRPAANGEFRAGEQWLKMMRASTLEEWREAMRIQARTTSNFTYADRAGNIFYVWVSASPALPHPSGGDSLAILATRADQVWAALVPFDSLPQLLNPPGGYLHNENDSPHYANLNAILPHDFGYPVEEPALRLRSQLAVDLLHNDRVFSLEDVLDAKHTPRMLLAERVKDDLVAAVRNRSPDAETAAAIQLLAGWDNTAAAESRGGLLFETWWNRYRSLMAGAEPHSQPWSEAAPATTPRGLADPDRAAEAFTWAVPETARRFGAWDAAWGDVHRVRRGDVDVPVAGCGGALGCFRVLNFANSPDGTRVANGGDGWILAVEFGDQPRAFSVLAYGQSPDPLSPFHANQAAMFAAGQLKPVLWSEDDIVRATIRRYRPGDGGAGGK